jgi:hypothetical protein
MIGLDIGCCTNKRPGCIGLEMNNSIAGIDVVHRVERGVSLPFKSETFDKIYMIDIVEHVDDIAWLLSEVHRVGIPNAYVEIQYPHYSGRNAFNDVTHRHYLGIEAFDNFVPGKKECGKNPYYTNFNRNFPFALEKTELRFKADVLSRPLFNIFGASFYEGYISQVLPISSVKLEMRILK